MPLPRAALALACLVGFCSAQSGPAAAKRAVPLRKGTEWLGNRKLSGKARIKLARKRKLTEVKKLLSNAGVAWPPYRVLFRVYKQQQELEVWARNRKGKLQAVVRYQICAASGKLGPKTRQGDEQVPEGFYRTTIFMPWTRYWMGMHINYPNGRDKRRRYTGSAIMIHGACASIGCMAMTDERIMELWLFSRGQRPRRAVPVHIYPARDLAGLIAKTKQPKLKAFWQQLKQGRDLVDARGRLPRIRWTRRGVYRFR
jgi:murein L,D-transpeptidase YafK